MNINVCVPDEYFDFIETTVGRFGSRVVYQYRVNGCEKWEPTIEDAIDNYRMEVAGKLSKEFSAFFCSYIISLKPWYYGFNVYNKSFKYEEMFDGIKNALSDKEKAPRLIKMFNKIERIYTMSSVELFKEFDPNNRMGWE